MEYKRPKHISFCLRGSNQTQPHSSPELTTPEFTSQTIQNPSKNVQSDTHPNLPTSTHSRHLRILSRSLGACSQRISLQIPDALPHRRHRHGLLPRLRMSGAQGAGSKAARPACCPRDRRHWHSGQAFAQIRVSGARRRRRLPASTACI